VNTIAGKVDQLFEAWGFLRHMLACLKATLGELLFELTDRENSRNLLAINMVVYQRKANYFQIYPYTGPKENFQLH